WLATDPMLERLPFQELHDDEGLPLVLPDVMDGANIRVIKRGGSTRLALEPLQGLAVLCQFFRQDLHGYQAAEPGVFSLVHYSHPTTTQLFQNAIVGDCLANHGKRTQALGSILLGRTCWQVNARILGQKDSVSDIRARLSPFIRAPERC